MEREFSHTTLNLDEYRNKDISSDKPQKTTDAIAQVEPEKPVATQPEIKASTAKPDLLKSFYKHHVQNLIDCDRLTQIKTFEDWKQENEQGILQSEYKAFIADCIEEDNLTAIKSLEEWLIIAV